MKKRLLLLILLLIGVLCLNGCDQVEGNVANTSEEETDDSQDDQDEEEDQDDEDKEKEDQGEEEDQASTQSEDGEVQHSPNITVYYSNEDATAFETEEVLMGSFSADNVLNALVDKGVVTADIKILSLEATTVDDKETLVVDFNSAFASYISSMGSSGEYYIMGGVCNTFLDAYDCDQIKITVEGGTLETGHAEYPGYMSKFS